jgi:UDP-glucose 4-epimerase
MRILVTGAAGFIGSWLSERLLALEHEVRGIDCLTDYYSPDMKRRNLRRALQNDRFHFFEEDLLGANLAGLLDGCETVFHQAAQAGVRASWGRDFQIYTDNNVLATQRLLEAARESSIKRLVYASSSSVYGDAENMPVSEEEPPRPVSPYGVTKLAAEHLCLLYHKNFGVPTIALRYFTVYGPRQRPDMAFHKFIRAILDKEPIALFGDGEQTRDFTYIDDAVESNMLAMEHGKPGTVYNIGGGSRISVNRTIEILEEITGIKAIVNKTGPQKGDVLHTWANTTRAQKDLGFLPRHSIADGLRNEVEWLKRIRAERA